MQSIRKFIMKWNKRKELWYLICRKNRFVQEFFDCSNVHSSFPGLDYETDNPYTVVINKGDTMSEANYYVKVELTVIGPKEGPVKSELEYQSTTKEMAIGIQQDLSTYFNSKNQGK